MHIYYAYIVNNHQVVDVAGLSSSSSSSENPFPTIPLRAAHSLHSPSGHLASLQNSTQHGITLVRCGFVL
jgi:hypothetical protein